MVVDLDEQSPSSYGYPIHMKKAQAKQSLAAKQKRKANKSSERRLVGVQPQPVRGLNLNAPQLGHSVSTFFRFKKGSIDSSVVIEGRDLAAVGVTASSATPATYVNTADQISCTTAINLVSRWGTYSALFARWRIRRLVATFVANQATTTVGNNYLAFAYDADTNVTSAEAIMRLNGAVMGNAYSDLRCKFDPPVQLNWYPTIGTAADQTIPGTVQFGTNGYSSSVVPGTIIYDYELEFAEPT